jgi:hypothetical protein
LTSLFSWLLIILTHYIIFASCVKVSEIMPVSQEMRASQKNMPGFIPSISLT